MRYATWMVIAAVFYGIFGLGLLLLPGPFMALYGVALDAGGQLMARILGSALASLALVFWLVRNDGPAPVRRLLQGQVVYNAVDLGVVLAAVLAGTMNAFGWGPVLLHLVLTAGFARFAFR